MGASCRKRGRKKGRKKGKLLGGGWMSQGRLEKKGDGAGVCRCVLKRERGGGSVPFLFNRLNWLCIVILDIIDIGISIPVPVAALGGILPPGCGSLFPARRLTRVAH